MLEFQEIQPGIHLLKVPFSGLWTGVVLITGEENCLIDSAATEGDVDAYILPALKKLGMDLSDIGWLLNTHSHGDHIGGHARLANLANLKVAAHASSAPKVEDPVPYAIETRTKFPEHSPAPQSYLKGVRVDRVMEDGEIIAGRLQVIHTPGHDDDCVCWYDLETKTLITGDSLQGNGTPAQGVGFYKDLNAYLASLEKLRQLPIEHIVCGHEYDKISWYISGTDEARSALLQCGECVRQYHSFISEQYQAGNTDPVRIARDLIRAHGCAMPERLFLALYTVTQHLEAITQDISVNLLGGNIMGRNVLVTGSSHGIGAAVAIAFAKQGDNVGITYLKSPEGAKAVQEECLKYGVDAQIFQVDLSVRAQCEKLMQDFLKHYETIDVLINNAGGALQIPRGEFEDMPLDYWDSQIALNLNACAYCAHAAIQNMKAHNTPGRIVNVSSVHGSVTWVKRKMLPYCAAKAGLDMFTKSLGVEVAPYGIRVNGIAPGLIITKIADRYKPEHLEGFLNKIPANILGQTEHIVPAILFLADVKNTEYIVGQVLTVDGGQSISGTIPAMKEDFER